MKKISTTVLLILISWISFSPINLFSQSVSYTVNYDDPYDINKVKADLQYLTMDGFTMGAGLSFSYEPFKHLLIDGQFRMTYWDILGKDRTAVVSEHSKNYSPFFEGGANFFFIDKLKKGKGKAKIVLSTSYSGTGYTTEKYIIVPCDKRRSVGLHGGVMNYNYTFLISQGSVFRSEDESEIIPPSGKYFSVNTSSFVTYLGLSTKKAKKIGVSTTNYGNRRFFTDNFVYADFLLGATATSDIHFDGQIIDTKGTPKISSGFRFGAIWNQKGVGTRMEVGKRPGVGQGYPYFLFAFSFTVVGREKKKM
jgi:hypothetical protein